MNCNGDENILILLQRGRSQKLHIFKYDLHVHLRYAVHQGECFPNLEQPARTGKQNFSYKSKIFVFV